MRSNQERQRTSTFLASLGQAFVADFQYRWATASLIMLNICARCGLYRPDKIIDAAGPYAVCPDCGHKHEFRLLPLLIISGANGAGKSTVCRELVGHVTGAVLLDCDMLWRPEFAAPKCEGAKFFRDLAARRQEHRPVRAPCRSLRFGRGGAGQYRKVRRASLFHERLLSCSRLLG
jgi:DNA-directed RNA polymerase subunit RPC12/RpoP